GDEQDEGVRRRHESERRHDDLVARPDVGENRAQLERGGARMRQQRPVAADAALEPRVAALGERAVAREVMVLVGLADIVELAPREVGLVEGDARHQLRSADRAAASGAGSYTWPTMVYGRSFTSAKIFAR